MSNAASPIVQTKPWGSNCCFLFDRDVEAHLANIVPHGFSSIHRHEQKDNLFFVVSGKLLVRHGDAETLLVAGQTLLVPAGVIHQFEALCEPVVLVEIYQTPWIRPDDINRYSENGVKACTAVTPSGSCAPCKTDNG